MDPKSQSELLLRRFNDPLPDWAYALPVAFAFGVLLLIVLFQRERRWASLLWSTFVLLALSAVYGIVVYLFKNLWSWWLILLPTLGIGLFYIGVMYFRDSRSIHPLWAAFLGLLRAAVYTILAVVFLLPGCQTFDTSETHPKVAFLFDVSGSMNTIDVLPEIGQDPSKLPTRQDQVIAWLSGDANKKLVPFMDRLLQKSPATAYRFGTSVDEINVQNFKAPHTLTQDNWREVFQQWLRPDKKHVKVDPKLDEKEQAKLRAKLYDLIDDLLGGTNVGGSALQVSKLEAGGYLQAIVIVSDGQSNLGSDEAVKEFQARIAAAKSKIHVITVGVGDYRQPVTIRVEDLQAPETARPDDKFPIRVPVIATGLPDEEFEVTLEVMRIKDKDGKAVQGEKTYELPAKKGKFKAGAGEVQQDLVEFDIDIQELRGIKVQDDKADVLEGTWQFKAKVPRHPREAFPKSHHENDPPTQVLVQKRKLRVLLFAGGPSREYQFVRGIFYREVVEKRVDLAVFLQTGREEGVDQDVEPEWLLSHFPDKLGPDDPRDKHSSLNEYDVIIAVDPDWTALENQQLKLLKEWVGNHAGGVIFVAGPLHTFQLARPAGLDLTPLTTIFPVILKDSRLHSIGIGHDARRPYLLDFTPAAKLYEFLRLDESEESPTAGWDRFFWGDEGRSDPTKDAVPKRGIHNYYPVEKLKPDSTVIATFNGPQASRINDGKDAQPYLVIMRYGQGKTMYVSSGELWRLRGYKETFHERLWIKMGRYMAGGAQEGKRYGRFLLARNYNTGTIAVEAQFRGPDLLPLSRDLKPKIVVKLPADFDRKLDAETPEAFEMRPKSSQGEWGGWFVGSFKVRTPGEYEFRFQVPGTSDSVSQRILVKKPNLEMDNVRNNFRRLYELASDANPVLNRLTPDARQELKRILQPPAGEDVKDLIGEGKSAMRLFFTLQYADAIPNCLLSLEPKRESVKGRLEDLWDQGYQSAYQMSLYHLSMLVLGGVGLIAAAILLFLRQTVAATVVTATSLIAVLIIFIAGLANWEDWIKLDLDISFVLVTVVALLSIEWLTRKLLKLA